MLLVMPDNWFVADELIKVPGFIIKKNELLVVYRYDHNGPSFGHINC